MIIERVDKKIISIDEHMRALIYTLDYHLVRCLSITIPAHMSIQRRDHIHVLQDMCSMIVSSCLSITDEIG
jgi:hypothetical protein